MSERYDPERRINELEDKLAATEVQRDEFDACNRSNSSQIECVTRQLQETEVRLEAAMDACQRLVSHSDEFGDWGLCGPGDFAFQMKEVRAALAMTPERAASVIEENKRLREAISEFSEPTNWGVVEDASPLTGQTKKRWWFIKIEPPWNINPIEFARQALAPKGETT